MRFLGMDGAQDVDAREDRSVVVRPPTDQGEDGARCKADDAAMTIQDLFFRNATETGPVLDLACDPNQLDIRQRLRTQSIGRSCDGL